MRASLVLRLDGANNHLMQLLDRKRTMSDVAWSSFSSTFSTRDSSFSSVSSFSGLTFGSVLLLCCASRRLTSVAICKSFSSTVLVSLAIQSFEPATPRWKSRQ
ncbi:hypothetical protein ACFX19_041427 [Malus domestica]